MNTIKKGVVVLFLIISVVILSFVSFSQTDLDFSDYPEFLIKEKGIYIPASYPPNSTVRVLDIDVTIVVGDEAKTEDQIGAGDIALSLQYYDPIRGTPLSVNGMEPKNVIGGTKLTNEVSYVETNNIIVGGPCANEFAARLLNLPMSWPECATGFEDGKGRIELYEKWGKIKILVAGMTASDTRRTTNVLANPKEYNLSGNYLEVTEDVSGGIHVRIVE